MNCLAKSVAAFFLALSVLLPPALSRAGGGPLFDSLRSRDPSRVEAACKALGVDRGYEGFLSAELVMVSAQPADYVLLALSWDGPNDGYLMLMSGEEVLDRQRVGRVKSLATYMTADQVSVLLDSIQGTGSGVREDLYRLLVVDAHKVRELWRGRSYYASFPLGIALDENMEERGIAFIEQGKEGESPTLKYQLETIRYNYSVDTQKLIVSNKSETVQWFRLAKDSIAPIQK